MCSHHTVLVALTLPLAPIKRTPLQQMKINRTVIMIEWLKARSIFPVAKTVSRISKSSTNMSSHSSSIRRNCKFRAEFREETVMTI